MRKKAKLTLFLLFLAMIALSVFLYFSSRVYWKYDDQCKKLYYFILFDNNNRAKKVVIGGQPGKV